MLFCTIHRWRFLLSKGFCKKHKALFYRIMPVGVMVTRMTLDHQLSVRIRYRPLIILFSTYLTSTTYRNGCDERGFKFPGWFMSSMYKICTDINVLAKTMSLSISNEPILNEEKIALPARWTIGPLSQWLEKPPHKRKVRGSSP